MVAWSTSELAGGLGELELFIAGWTMPAQSVITFCAGLVCPNRQQAISTQIEELSLFIFRSS
jgi:hypothetical protein